MNSKTGDKDTARREHDRAACLTVDSMYQMMVKPLLDPTKRLSKIVLNLHMVAQIVSAMGYLHRMGVVHGSLRAVGTILRLKTPHLISLLGKHLHE